MCLSFSTLDALLDDTDGHGKMMHEIVRDGAKSPAFERPIVSRANVEHVGIRELLVDVPLNQRPRLALTLDLDELVRDFPGVSLVEITFAVLDDLGLLFLNLQIVRLLQVVEIREVLLRVQGDKVQRIEDIRSDASIVGITIDMYDN